VQTKRGAEQYDRQLRQEFAEDETHGRNPFAGPPPTFGEFAERWMREYVTPNNRSSVQRSKHFALGRHLLPRFGRCRLDEITTAAIDRFIADEVQHGLRPKTVNNILSVLHTSLATAADWGLLRGVPRHRWLRVGDTRFRALSEAEELALLAHVPLGFWRAFVVFLLHTGARFSEAAAAEWSDLQVDQDTPVIRICRGGANGIPGATKTGSHRTLPLTAELLSEIARLGRTHERIFPKPDGGMMNPASKMKYLHRFCRLAGLDPFGWHTLRHTFASRLAAAGTPVHVLQRLLGHTTLKMTMRYVHVDPATLIATAATIRHALPIPDPNGTPVVTRPPPRLPMEAISPVDFRSTQQKTDPLGSASVWSG